MDIYTSIRNLLASVFSVMFAYFAPIQNMVFVIFFVFAINCMAGMIARIVAKHERFNLKKFFHCMLETFVFYVIVLSVFTIGEKMRNLDGAIQCITGVVYAILYFYGVNTLRNLNILFPESKVIRFLFYVLSFEVVKKIPYMQQFINKEKEGGK